MGLWVAIILSTFCIATQAQREQRHFGSHCYKELRNAGTLKYPGDKPAEWDLPPYHYASGVNGAENCLFYGQITQGRQVVLVFSAIAVGTGMIRIETKETLLANWKLNQTIAAFTLNTITVRLKVVNYYRIVVKNTVISFSLQYWNTDIPTPPTLPPIPTSSSSTTPIPWLWLFLLNNQGKPHPPQPTYLPPWDIPTIPTLPPWNIPTLPPWNFPTKPSWPPWDDKPTVWPPWGQPTVQTCHIPYGWQASWCTDEQNQGSYCEFSCTGGGNWLTGGTVKSSMCSESLYGGGPTWQPPLGSCGAFHLPVYTP